MSRTSSLDEYDSFYAEILDVDDLKQLTDKIMRVAVPFIELNGKINASELYSSVDPFFSGFCNYARIQKEIIRLSIEASSSPGINVWDKMIDSIEQKQD